jgi:signal peptidase I
MNGKVRGLLLAVLFLAVLALTPLRLLKVSGRSMEPTFQDGETYLLDQFYWKLTRLQRNDIVVVDHGDEKWVKRLIGMPGDHLQIHSLRDGWIANVSNLTVNPSLRQSPQNVRGRLEEIRVKPGEIFVIGDNLNRSADSTHPEGGTFKLGDVIGIVRTFTFRRDFPFRRHL